MKRFNLIPKAGSDEFPSTPRLEITEADDGEWVRHIDAWHVVMQNRGLLDKAKDRTMADRHWEIARKRANDEKKRADKYEDMLIKINKLIFAKGISYTGDDYWTVRGMCAEAARAKDEREKG